MAAMGVTAAAAVVVAVAVATDLFAWTEVKKLN